MRKGNGKIWLSHSGLDILYRCPRCFWLRYNRGLMQPEGITSRLPDRFDRVIKNYFALFRVSDELPSMIKDKVGGKLENPFQETYFYPLDEKYGFWGKLDECLVTPENLYIPADFKTSSTDPRNKKAFPAYQNQLDEFSFLLEKNGKKTAGLGYLIYFYPDISDKLHDGFPMIVHIETLKTNPNSVLPRIQQAIGVLEGTMPAPAPECSFCKWREEVNRILSEK